jgi:Mn2+/Fe2+ NRAMP family transporter
MGKLVEIATVLSFVTAPFYAILNYKLVTSKKMPDKYKPNRLMKFLSITGIIFLLVFSFGYLFVVI